MPQPKITLYFDIVSPFAYLAFYLLENSPIFKDVEITYMPIFLGGLMKATGNRPPLEIRNKDTYTNTTRLRLASLFNIPTTTKLPEPFPLPTLPIQRLLTAVRLSHPHLLVPLITSLWDSLWVNCNNISAPEHLEPVLERVLGKDLAAKMVAASQGDEAKEETKSKTAEADKAGAFGVPWFHCTTPDGRVEGFWGVEEMGMVADFLGLKGDLRAQGAEKGWKALL